MNTSKKKIFYQDNKIMNLGSENQIYTLKNKLIIKVNLELFFFQILIFEVSGAGI